MLENLQTGEYTADQFDAAMGNNLPDATSSPLSASDPSEFWYERIDHNGTSPFIPDGSQWRVFRNAVVEYGADPKGAVDSQPAFQRAVNGA